MAETPGAPIIILIEDRHGTPDSEWEMLECLHASLGINTVGVEGWAGPEVDKGRGREILNGEENLIRKIRTDRRFTCVPLEDPQLQIRALKLTSLSFYLTSRQIIAEMEREIAQGKIPQRFAERNRKRAAMLAENWRSIANSGMQQHGWAVDDAGFLEHKKEAETYLGKPLEDFVSPENGSFNNHPDVRNIVVTQRSEESVRRMLEHMKASRTRVGAVVYGRGHTDSIIDYAKRRKDVHIYAVKYKSPDSRQ